MKKRIAGILSLVLTVTMVLGTAAYAAVPDAANQLPETGKEKTSEAQVQSVISSTIRGFKDFDMAGFEPFATRKVEKGTEEDALDLPTTIPALVEGQEEATDIPITWKCTDDSFGGDTYQPNHENDSVVYTFEAKLADEYSLTEELQQKLDAGEIRMPWIEVSYEKTENQASDNAKSNQDLVADTSYSAIGTNEAETLKFITGSNGSNIKAFDIQGLSGTTPVQTTYKNYGYELFLAVGDTTPSHTGQPTSTNENGNINIANGQVGTVSGMQVQPRIGFTDDGAYVKVTYRIYNPNDTPKVIDLCGGSDIQIGTNDSAAINKSATGITMVEGVGKSQFSLYSTSTFGVTPVDTLWFGSYNSRFSNYWKGTTEQTSSGDSGIAFSWQNRVLAPGASTDFTLLFGVGEPVNPPEIDVASDIALDYSANTVGVKAKVQDVTGRKYKVHYSMDDGAEQTLSATEKTLNTDESFTDSTINAWGTEFITATNSKQGIVGNISVPADWAENSVHKLQIWVKNDLYAMSDVKTVYVMKKASTTPGGGDEIVEAQQYDLSYNANEGTGTAPTTTSQFEGTKVTLPVNPFTRTGYVFRGWSADNGTTLYQPGDEYTMPSENTTLKAIWSKPITPENAAPINATYGTAIDTVQLSATGGASDLTYVVAEGQLPAGLTLTSDGKITGTPTTITTDPVTVTVNITDTTGQSATMDVTVSVGKKSVKVTGAANTEKVYDATDTINPGKLTLTGVIDSEQDAVTASYTSASFASASAANSVNIEITGLTLTGNKSGNYVFDSSQVTRGEATITGKITKRDITVKPSTTTKKVGMDKPTQKIEEVVSSTSALQGNDTLSSLGTPSFAYPNYEDSVGSHNVTVTFASPNPNYNITCQDGSLTVTQDAPVQDTNYTVSGTVGNNGWYRGKITVAPKGSDYDKFVDGEDTKNTIEVENESKNVDIQLKNSTTGAMTSTQTITLQSDAVAPTLGEISVAPKNGGLLASIGRTLTFGHFFKEAIKVTVPVSDAVSGVAYLDYKLPGDTRFTRVTLTQGAKSGNAVFDIPVGTNGTILVKAADVAGNTNAESNLEKDGSDVWTVESTAPGITDISTTASQQNGWFKSDVTLGATVTDTVSGLHLVSWSLDKGTPVKLLDNPTTKQTRYAFEQTLSANGTHTVQLNAEDNATNQTSSSEMTVKIDKEVPTITNVIGNPTGWQNEEAEISFKIKDEVSGLNSTVPVTVKKDNVEVTLTKEGDTYKFTTKGNGTYVVEAADLAGNQIAATDNIVVNRIQTEKPQTPTSDDIKDSIVVGGNTNPTEGVPTSPDGWYTTSEDIVIDIKNDTTPANGGAPLTYQYQIWKEGEDADKAEVITLKDDESNQPTITEEGIWHMKIWQTDAAANTSEPLSYTIRNDYTAPETVNVNDGEQIVVKNGKEESVSAVLKDDISGVDPASIKVTYHGTDVAFSTEDKKNGIACNFDAKVGGTYLVTGSDNAGNPYTSTILITALNAEVICKDGIAAESNQDNLLDVIDLSGYQNGETVSLRLTMKRQSAEESAAILNQWMNDKDKTTGAKIFFDVSLNKIVQPEEGNLTEETITKTDKPVSIALTIPEEMRGAGSYEVVRAHDSKIDELTTKIRANGEQVLFETDKFSSYALRSLKAETVIADTTTASDAVDTGDHAAGKIVWYLILALVSAGIIGMTLIRRRNTSGAGRHYKNHRHHR